MKSVLIAIQPYWVFLIIAKIMGWEINQEKTVEVRKTFPKDLDWNKKAIIYCSKNKQSFNRIPKKYQPLMEKFLGKVIGKFVCDRSITAECGNYAILPQKDICLDVFDLLDYADEKTVYGWHISNLVICDEPKELRDFKPYNRKDCYYSHLGYAIPRCKDCHKSYVKRPPQSYMFVEDMGV